MLRLPGDPFACEERIGAAGTSKVRAFSHRPTRVAGISSGQEQMCQRTGPKGMPPMMIELRNAGGLVTCRVWLGELPTVDYQPERLMERAVPAASSAITGIRRAAVEMFLLRDHTPYALIGGEFTPHMTGQLLIQIAVSRLGTEKPGADTLHFGELTKAHPDKIREYGVYAGLPEMFARHVIAGTADAGPLLGSGQLRFDHAVYSPLSSSEWIFKRVTTAAVRILVRSEESASEETLHEIIGL